MGAECKPAVLHGYLAHSPDLDRDLDLSRHAKRCQQGFAGEAALRLDREKSRPGLDDPDLERVYLLYWMRYAGDCRNPDLVSSARLLA